MAIGQYFDAQRQSHQIFKNHHLGGIPGVSLVEARGIPWGILGSCGSLLGDLIREEEKRMALL
jgi:hypothetical protein